MISFKLDFLERENGEKVINPKVGERFYIKCAGGYVMQVDPKTRECTTHKQLFELINEETMELKKVAGE